MSLTAARIKGKNAQFAALAQCYAVIDGTRYNFAQAISLEATGKKSKVKVPILGQTTKGNKSAGLEYTGKATLHFNTTIFRKMMYNYQQDGTDVYFDLIITNCDPTSENGQQTITLKDCNLDDTIIAKFDAGGELLQEDANFTFEGFEINEEFTTLSVILEDGTATVNP